MNIEHALGYADSIIDRFEGYAETAYLDRLAHPPRWTIGRGTTVINGKPVTEGMTCTRDQADTWSMDDLASACAFVRHCVKVPLDDEQLGALTSLCYNIGDGHFAKSDVLSALNLGLPLVAANRFLEYDHAGGIAISGLRSRRACERAMFLFGAMPNIEETSADALNQAQIDKFHPPGANL